eukprot:4715311-Amphidinium_carterae.1
MVALAPQRLHCSLTANKSLHSTMWGGIFILCHVCLRFLAGGAVTSAVQDSAGPGSSLSLPCIHAGAIISLAPLVSDIGPAVGLAASSLSSCICSSGMGSVLDAALAPVGGRASLPGRAALLPT